MTLAVEERRAGDSPWFVWCSKCLKFKPPLGECRCSTCPQEKKR